MKKSSNCKWNPKFKSRLKNPPISCHFPNFGAISKKKYFLFSLKNYSARSKLTLPNYFVSVVRFPPFSPKTYSVFYATHLSEFFPAKKITTFFHSVILSPGFDFVHQLFLFLSSFFDFFDFFSSTFAFLFSRDRFS